MNAHQAQALLERTITDARVLVHCQDVADMACRIARAVREQGHTVDLKQVEVMGLLHDLGRAHTLSNPARTGLPVPIRMKETPMKIATQENRIPGHDAAERLDKAAGFGFQGIEVGWQNLKERVTELKAASRASGLPISTICSSSLHDPLALEPQERAERLDRMVGLLELAEELGAGGSICVPIRRSLRFPDLSPAFSSRELISKLAADMLAQAVHRTEGLEALILLEPLNRYEAYYLRSLADGVELARMVDHPRVKVMADFFHMSIEEADIAASIRAAGDWIRHVHLADSNRMLPGQGHTDFKAGFAALKEIGFRGFMALECGILGDPEVELPRSVQFMRSQVTS